MSGTWQDWKAWVPNDVACRRAGGRDRYNKKRQKAAEERRRQIADVLAHGHDFEPGFQRRLAERFAVSETTICFDLKLLFESGTPCPCCGMRRRRRRS
jgi:hypothetical protein